jgi:hypothetical protein
VRHVVALGLLVATLVLVGVVLDRIARRSAAPGIVLILSGDPARTLASLPTDQGRIVNTWMSGRIVQLHVESMRGFDASMSVVLVEMRLPAVMVALAGCG